MLIFIFYNEKKIEEMTSISKSPVRWRSEGRALALKERGSPSEAFRKPVITDPTYIKRCRQPPATSHQPARSVSSVSLFAFFSPSSLSSSSLYLCRPVRTSFFLSNLFILLWCTFTRSFFRFLFSFVFSFVLSVHFERPPASTPTAVHLIWPFPPLYASKGLSDSSFILSSYFTYSQFLSFLSSISSSSSLSFYPLLLALSLLFHILDCSVGNRGLLLGIVRKTDYNRKKERVEREEETMSNIFHSSSFFFFCSCYLWFHYDISLYIEIYRVFYISFYTFFELFCKIFRISLITLTSTKLDTCIYLIFYFDHFSCKSDHICTF